MSGAFAEVAVRLPRQARMRGGDRPNFPRRINQGGGEGLGLRLTAQNGHQRRGVDDHFGRPRLSYSSAP